MNKRHSRQAKRSKATYKLELIAARLGVELDDAHDTAVDFLETNG